MNLLYLKPKIKAEPLIWHWYAWSHLIAPLPAACNIVERHLKIMHSYISNPQIHAQAVKDPKLLGGPFIDLNGQKVDEVKELINKTKKDCEKLIEINTSYKELDRTLQNEAQGDTLEPFYNRIPNNLKGLVELVYDLNSRPSIRLIEALIYKKYYSDQHQSIALSEVSSDYRKFIMSTPRIAIEDEVYLPIPFSDQRLDLLFSMKESPQSLEEINSILELPNIKKDMLLSFFTTEKPHKPNDRNYNGDGLRLRYFGHACMLVQTKNVSILFDPVISYPIENTTTPRYTLADLPDHIDYVVITHNHQDHLMFETLLQIRHKIGHIVFPSNHSGSLEDPSIKLILKHTGFSSLIELREMDTIALEDGQIIALPFFGEHSDLNIQTKLSYGLQIKGKKLIFAADSNNIEPTLYDHVYDHLGPIDILFLGMECDGAPLSWLYGPLLSTPISRSYDKNRNLSGSNYEKAWLIVQKLQCKKAYIYAMGQEPWLEYISSLRYTPESIQIIESDKLIQACRDTGIDAERLFGKKEWMLD